MFEFTATNIREFVKYYTERHENPMYESVTIVPYWIDFDSFYYMAKTLGYTDLEIDEYIKRDKEQYASHRIEP